MTPLHPDFLSNSAAYDASVRAWIDLWNGVDPATRAIHGWVTPWVHTGHPSIRDGNPIFSAVGGVGRKRGIRVIQYEPEPADPVGFLAYGDTFGGSADDPDSVHELVIACVLSEDSLRIAGEMMTAWVRGEWPEGVAR